MKRNRETRSEKTARENAELDALLESAGLAKASYPPPKGRTCSKWTPQQWLAYIKSFQGDTLTCHWCREATITVRPGEEPHDAADRMKWYDGSVCPSCAREARAADEADDRASEG